MTKYNLHQKGIFLVLLLLILAFIFPWASWGFNHILFLPPALTFVLVAISLGLVVFHKKLQFKFGFSNGGWLHWVLFPLASLVISYFLPLATEAYGDTSTILTNYQGFFGEKKNSLKAFLALVDFDMLNLHNGERFTFNFIYLLMQHLQLNMHDAFRVFGSFWAVLSSMVFLFYLKRLAIANYFFPFLFFFSLNSIMVFSGHIEVYAPTLFFLFLFAWAIKFHLDKNSNLSILVVVIVAFFMVKSHFAHVLVLAPLVMLLVLKIKPGFIQYLTSRNMLVVFSSATIAFFLAYFFIFKNHNANYAERDGQLLSNVFLPLFSSQEPFNHYGLFHINHIIDFFSLLLLWSPVIWFALVLGFKKKDSILWDANESILILMLISHAFIAFVINPLLSMPRDWDILSIGAPLILLLLVNQWKNLDKTKVEMLKPILLATFLVTTVPRYIVEANKDLSAKRLLTVGARTYSTYYAGSSVLLSKAVKQSSNLDIEYLKVFSEKLVNQSKHYPDNELCHFLTQTAIWLAEEKRKEQLALDFLRLALEQNNEYEIALKYAALLLQKQNNFTDALPIAQTLVTLNNGVKEYHQLLINSLYGLKMRKELEIACYNYLKLFPEDEAKIASILNN